MPLLFRYVTKEIASPFWISLFVFTGILFLARSIKLVELVINKSVPVGDILMLFSCVVPRFLEIALPMSLLLAVILGFGRLSSDSELVVLRAAGVSLRQLGLPVLAFASVTMIVGFFLSFYLRPLADFRLGVGMFEIAKAQAGAGLTAGTFNELGQLTIYAENISDNGSRLSNVIIGDRRDPKQSRTFVAKHGQIVSDNKRRTLSLKLFDGSIPEGSGLDFSITYFEINNISLPHSAIIEENDSKEGKRQSEMYMGELISYISKLRKKAEKTNSHEDHKRLARYRVEFHKRIVLPFSCLAIALIALALGVQPSRGGHTWGAAASVGVGIALIVLYYLLFALSTALGKQGVTAVWLLMWMPNIIFMLLGYFLFNRIGSEQWLAVSEGLGDRLTWLFNKISLNNLGASR